MTLNIFPILNVLFYFLCGIIIWKVNSKYIRIVVTSLMLIMFFIPFFKFDQEGGASLEKFSSDRFDNIPPKVEVLEENFNTKQAKEFNTLKQQSGDLKDEETNQ